MNDSSHSSAPQPPSAPKVDFLTRVASRVPRGVLLVFLSAICGMAAGAGAWLLKYLIGHVATFIFAHASETGVIWLLGICPVVGVLLTVLYQKYISRCDLEHGTARLIKSFAAGDYTIKPAFCLHPILASTLTLGLGGSAGGEGPIAYSGAAVGSNVARIFGVDSDMQRILTGCGAGAGIAGIFKAPVAGILFTLEVLKLNLTTLSVLALTVAGICGSLTCYILTNFSFDIQFLPDSFFDPAMLGWVALLGLFCGLYSVYYNRITDLLTNFFKSVSNRWLRGLIGGSIVGVCIMLFPVLYGEGYGAVTKMINDLADDFARGGLLREITAQPDSLLLMALAVLMLKVFACIASNSAGGVAGSFTPTVFAGVFAGYVFAVTANLVFHADLPVGLFCLFGAAGAFSGIIHAPLMAIFLVCEVVGNGFGYFLPVTITSALSYIVVKLLTPGSTFGEGHHDDIKALTEKK